MTVDSIKLNQTRQQKIDDRCLRENARREFVDYKMGMFVFHLRDRNSKVDPVFDGPYLIEEVHANGTVTIRTGQQKTDRVNIRNIRPANAESF